MVYSKYSDHICGQSKSQKTKVEDKTNNLDIAFINKNRSFWIQMFKSYSKGYLLLALFKKLYEVKPQSKVTKSTIFTTKKVEYSTLILDQYSLWVSIMAWKNE